MVILFGILGVLFIAVVIIKGLVVLGIGLGVYRLLTESDEESEAPFALYRDGVLIPPSPSGASTPEPEMP